MRWLWNFNSRASPKKRKSFLTIPSRLRLFLLISHFCYMSCSLWNSYVLSLIRQVQPLYQICSTFLPGLGFSPLPESFIFSFPKNKNLNVISIDFPSAMFSSTVKAHLYLECILWCLHSTIFSAQYRRASRKAHDGTIKFVFTKKLLGRKTFTQMNFVQPRTANE